MYGELERDYINYALHFSLWHYNTLSEPTKSKLKDKLKNEWFKELGIADKNRAYFYNKREFDEYQKIIDKVVTENSKKEKEVSFLGKLKRKLK